MGGDETAAVTTALDANTLFFLLGVAVDCFLATLKTERRWVRNLLRGMTAILVLGAFSWPFLSKLLPTFAASMTSLVSNAWAWFALVLATAIISSLSPAIKQWQDNRLPTLPVVTALTPPIAASREGSNLSLALSQAVAASTVIDTGQVPSIVAFVVVRSYVNYTEKKNFPLKLHVIWANEGEGIHLGKPQWIAGRISTQGRSLGQDLMHRYKVSIGKEETESEEVTVNQGQRGELWIGLDPSVDINKARLWSMGDQLGILVLPVTVRNMAIELRIRL